MGTNHESPQMQTLHAIREQRSQKVNEARSLLASMPTLTPEAQTKFDAIKAEIVNLEGQEARAQFIEEAERRSLGQFAIVDHLRQAAMVGLPYVYLGYWVQGSPKMDYKARFRPMEALRPLGWERL